MSDALAYNSGPLYYRHSGRVSGGGLVRALVLGTLAALAMGAAYAYIDLYNPIAGWVTFLVTGGTGFVMGLLLSKFIKSGKIRSLPLAMLLAAWVTGVMFVGCWEIWIFAFLQRAGLEVSLGQLLVHPLVTWDLLLEINAVGAWKLKEATPTGLFLWAIWAAEAGALLGIPLTMAWRAVREFPFCEQCNKWCTARDIINIKPGDAASLRPKLEAKDFSVLTALGQAPSVSHHFWHVYFQGCADCDTTQTLCVDDYALSYDKNGKLQTKKKPIVTRLLLTSEDTVEVATVAAMLATPAPAPEEAEAPPAPETSPETAASDAPSTPDTPAT